MTIGIIGSGGLGANVARALGKAGIPAVIANRRGPDSLAPLVEEVGASLRAVSVQEAAAADIVLLAVRWTDLSTLLPTLPAWNQRIVIDGTNPVEFLEPGSPDANDPTNPLAAWGIKAVDLGGRHSSAVVRDLLPGARVVKAFNHLDVKALLQPGLSGGSRVQFYSGDDAAARAEVRSLIERMGFFPVDLGALDVGGPLATLPFGPLAAIDFVRV